MRTVLFLINGFGIEMKDSYSVYSSDLMPNFNNLMNKYMFQKLNTNVRTMYEGFRNMSLEVGELYNYHIYDKETLNGKILSNKTFNLINNSLDNSKKMHIFAFIDTSMKIVDNLKDFLKNINKEKNKKIFLHLVLTSTNYEDYPLIIEVLSKINVDLAEYASIGMVLGIETLLNSNPVVELNFFLKMMITEVGEKWQSFNQKLDVSYRTKKSPTSIKPFVVNNGFSIEANDLCLIWNYDKVDITNFINGIKSINYGNDVKNNISFYTLFPIIYNVEIPYFFNYEKSEKSLASNMKGLSFKTLVVTETKTVNAINYYLNGLESINNDNITYLSLDNYLYDVNTVVNIINKYNHELVIFNYDITNFNTVEELEVILKNIDNVIGGIYNNTEKNSYTIIISSLYGMNKSVLNSKGEICHIYYDKVPIVFVDNFITKKNYLINNGSIDDLFKLCYKMINKSYPAETLISKKNLLYRIVFK